MKFLASLFLAFGLLMAPALAEPNFLQTVAYSVAFMQTHASNSPTCKSMITTNLQLGLLSTEAEAMADVVSAKLCLKMVRAETWNPLAAAYPHYFLEGSCGWLARNDPNNIVNLDCKGI